MNKESLIPWDVIIEILNKYQSYNPGHASERVNKFVNDEIYEWVNSQPTAVDEKGQMLEVLDDLRYNVNSRHTDVNEALGNIYKLLDYLVRKE